MIRIMLAGALMAFGLSGCAFLGLTSEERQSLIAGSGDTLNLAVIKVRDMGYDPVGADAGDLRLAQDVCALVDTGSPLIVSAVNIVVARHNASAAADEQIDPWTVDEFRAELATGCAVAEALLTPAPDEAEV